MKNLDRLVLIDQNFIKNSMCSIGGSPTGMCAEQMPRWGVFRGQNPLSARALSGGGCRQECCTNWSNVALSGGGCRPECCTNWSNVALTGQINSKW